MTRVVGGSGWRRSQLAVLCYHGVALRDEHVWDGHLFVTQAFLARRLKWLRDHGYVVLPLGEAVEMQLVGRLPPRAVTITFDDGMWNFLPQAWPVLRHFGVPATVYLSTYYCDRDLPVFNPLVAYLLWRARGRMISGAPLLGTAVTWDLRTRQGIEAAFWTVMHFADARRLDASARDCLAGDVARLLGIVDGEIREGRMFHLLTPSEVRDLAANGGVEIEMHTHRHRSPREKQPFLMEIRENCGRIREYTGRTPRHFCYPSGVWHPEYLQWLGEVGVESATTGVAGLVGRRSHRLLLPRVTDHLRLSLSEFEAWVSGTFQLVPSGRRAERQKVNRVVQALAEA